VLPREVDETIRTFKNSLDDTLVPTRDSRFHRQLESKGLYVFGDVSSAGWSNSVFKNLRKFYKARTSNDLKKTEPLNAPAISIVTDLTIFDGQINNTVDYSKTSDVDEKFVNNARAFIANNLIRGGDVAPCIFDTQYYIQSDNNSKGYYYLLTIPIDNVDEFYGILRLSGVYKFSRIQFAWLASQFYRARYIKDNGFDIFDKTIEDVGVAQVLGQQNFNLFKREFEALRDSTKKFLPDLDNFNEEFVDIMIFYYEQWISQNYLGAGNIEESSKSYCDLTVNGIYTTSADYADYKVAYSQVLSQFVDTIDVVPWNPQKILVEGTQLYQSLGIRTLSEDVLRQFIIKWIETFK
jgi:hypothetical protein